jgi:hypothetical protein
MLASAKHIFIAHRGNHHRPHLLRPLALLVVGVIITLQQLSPWHPVLHSQGAVLAYASNINPIELLKSSNAERVKAGLPPFRIDYRLNASASDKAADMFAADYWSHVSPTGVQPWHWFEQEQYVYAFAGENLAKDFDTSAGVIQGWMNSQTHRDNLLNSHYSDIGFAVQNGTLQGKETTLVVAHYGALARPVAQTQSVVPPPVTAAPVAPKTIGAPAPLPPPTQSPILVQKPISAAKVEAISPEKVAYSAFKPLPASQTLTMGSKLSLTLLLLILLTMLASHFTVWRKKVLHGFSHRYKLRVATELALAGAGIVVIIIRSYGIVN